MAADQLLAPIALVIVFDRTIAGDNQQLRCRIDAILPVGVTTTSSCSSFSFKSCSYFPTPSSQHLNSGLSCKLAPLSDTYINRYLDSLSQPLCPRCRVA